MRFRYAMSALLLLVTAACGQSTTPTASTPTPAACSYALSTGSTINGYPTGGSFTVAVVTTPATGCNWTATSNATWIHVAAGASASHSAEFTFTVDANPGPARTGTVTVATQTITFNQTANTAPQPGPQVCAFTLSIGSTIDGYPNGGSFDVRVTTTPPIDCGWTAVSNVPWIHITQGSNGIGSDEVKFTVDANPGLPRSGTLTIATKTVVFNQSGS
jgi:hypothetical protein